MSPEPTDPLFAILLMAGLWAAFILYLVHYGSNVPPDQPG